MTLDTRHSLYIRHSTLDTPCRRGRRQGFTLVELMVVIAIMAIVLAVGVFRLSRAGVLMAEGERVARTLVADLRMAHSQAVTESKNHAIVFTDGGSKYTDYTIYRVEAGGDVQVEPTRPLPDTVAVTGSSTRVEFTPGGDALAACTCSVTSPGCQYTITVVLATGAVVLEEAGP